MPTTFLSRTKTRQALQGAFDFAENQLGALVQKYPADYYPLYSVGGKFGLDAKRWTHGGDGFYPGLMFLFAEAGDDEEWLDLAVKFSKPLEKRRFDRSVHDLGALFLPTYARWIDMDGPEEEIQKVLVQAGKTLAMRFQERGQYLRSFLAPNSLFIDLMMNVGLLFHAGLEDEDQHLLDIANRHCEVTRRVLVRGDGSVAQEAIFDLESGEVLRQSTQQGYRGDSCWSRGLAASIYGFTRSFLQSGVGEYLETAQLNADYYLAQTPPIGIAPWDFDAPESGPLARGQVDTSATALAASGLLDLADATTDATKSRAYRDFALTSLKSLAKDHLGKNTRGFEGILGGGVYHIHQNLGVNEAVMLGDYFFVEALAKALDFLEEEAPDAILEAYPEDSLPASARNWVDGATEVEMAAPVAKSAK